MSSAMRPLLLKWASFAFALLIIAAAITAYWGQTRYMAPGPLQEEKIVLIPRGAGLNAIAGKLQREGVIEDALIFRIGARLTERARNLKAGEFAFPAQVSMAGVVDILEAGKVVTYAVTIPEGKTSLEIVALLRTEEALSGEIAEVPAEGSLLPETYHYVRGDSRAALLKRMEANLSGVLQELWEKRAEGLPLRTPEEALILASIVEKETGVPEERPLVAGVFINRLKRRMRLQSDPTVVYGLTGGKAPLGRSLTRADLKQPTPYNTYTIDRLPPTPIANVGRSALEAVLNPADTKYLYFVADGTGGHAFARTLREHNNNVRKWRKIRNGQ